MFMKNFFSFWRFWKYIEWLQYYWTFVLQGPDDVIKMGIQNYNQECRKIVMRYSREWEVSPFWHCYQQEIVCRLVFFSCHREPFQVDHSTSYLFHILAVCSTFVTWTQNGLQSHKSMTSKLFATVVFMSPFPTK